MSILSTSSGYRLDTSVLIEVLRRNVVVRQRLDSLQGMAYLSSVALGELNYGAKHSAYPAQNLADLAALTGPMTILAAGAKTANLYGEMRHDLATRGLLIPDSDIWMAAAAAQYGLTLAARDTHFQRVSGLNVELWQLCATTRCAARSSFLGWWRPDYAPAGACAHPRAGTLQAAGSC